MFKSYKAIITSQLVSKSINLSCSTSPRYLIFGISFICSINALFFILPVIISSVSFNSFDISINDSSPLAGLILEEESNLKPFVSFFDKLGTRSTQQFIMVTHFLGLFSNVKKILSDTANRASEFLANVSSIKLTNEQYFLNRKLLLLGS